MSLLDFVVRPRPLLSLIQFPESFLNMLDGFCAMTTPISARLLQVIVRFLEGITGRIYLGWHVFLRGLRK